MTEPANVLELQPPRVIEIDVRLGEAIGQQRPGHRPIRIGGKLQPGGRHASHRLATSLPVSTCDNEAAAPLAALNRMLRKDRDPDGPPIAIELRATGRPAVIEVSGGSVRTRLGTTPTPDLVLRGTPQLILGLISAHLTPGQAKEAGLEIEGNVGVLTRLQPEAASAD